MKRAHITGVVRGSGGVGASVLTAAIAVRAAQAGTRPVCLDGDRLGGDLKSPSGLSRSAGALARSGGGQGRVDGPELVRRLPSSSVGRAGVLSFERARDVPRAAEIVRDVLFALGVVSDVVVIDLPRPS